MDIHLKDSYDCIAGETTGKSDSAQTSSLEQYLD